MNKVLSILLAGLAATSQAALAKEKGFKEFNTMGSMGCMLLQECTDNVRRIRSIEDIKSAYPDSIYSAIGHELNQMLLSLDKIGVMVFLADQKYFPVGHRGVYHTVSNNFFLNDAFMHRQSTLMSVMRHEGWHVAQDCMAGSIENNMIAIIKPEEDVPKIWRNMTEKTYPKHSVPWEAEASWAGRTEGMTMKALESCAAGTMWTDYKPTPLTNKWLKENGFIK